MKGKTWRKAAAFVLSLTLVAGMMPANVGGFLTGSVGIVASAENADAGELTEFTNALVDGNTVKLTAAITATESIVIPANANVTIDLNKSKLNAEQGIVISEGATLTLKAYSNSNTYAFTGNLTVKNGATLNLTKVKVIGKVTGEAGSTIDNTASSTATIAPTTGIAVETSGTFNNKGTITSTDNVAIVSGGTVSIIGGTITGETALKATAGTVTISGTPTLNGKGGAAIDNQGATVSVSGGTYKNNEGAYDVSAYYTPELQEEFANGTKVVNSVGKISNLSDIYATITRNNSVIYCPTLYNALDVAVAGDTITMLKDLGVSNVFSSFNLADGITLDLNNHTLKTTIRSKTCFYLYSGSLKIINGTIDGDVVVFGSSTFTAGDGLTIEGYDMAISGNHNQGNGSTINIEEGATINCTRDGYAGIGIFQPVENCTVNISGGTINAKTGIYAKTGTFNISGGTIGGTGAKQEQYTTANGCQSTGDAIAVQAYPTSYGDAPTINITGGTLASENSSAVSMYNCVPTGKTVPDGTDADANLNISGTANVQSVNVEDGGIIEISGGTVGELIANKESTNGTPTKNEITISGGEIGEITQNLGEGNTTDKLTVTGGNIGTMNLSNIDQGQVSIKKADIVELNVDEGKVNGDGGYKDNIDRGTDDDAPNISETNYAKTTSDSTVQGDENVETVIATVDGATDLTYTSEELALIKENPTLTLKKGDTNVENTDNKYKLQYVISAETPTDITEWKDNAADIHAANAGTYKVWYRVVKTEDTTTTQVLAPTAITVTINKAKCEMTTAPTANNTTYNGGENIALVNEGTASSGKIWYANTDTSQLTAPADDSNDWSPTPPVSPSAAKYRVWYKVIPTDANNYEGISAKHIDVTIAKANITPEVNITGWQYGSYSAETNAPSVTGNSGEGEVTYQYKVKTASTSTYSDTVPTAVGEYTVRATIAATENYNGGTATADFKIAQGTSVITITPTASLAYDGTAKMLATYTQTGDNTYYFAVTDSDVDTAPAIEADWATTISTETYAGTYKIWYKAAATDNYAGVEAKAYETNVTISPAAFAWTTAPTLTSSRTYYGSAIQLITRQGVPKYGDAADVEYAVTTTDQAPASDGGAWTEYNQLKATAADTYYIWYQVKAYDADGDGNPECAAVAPAKLGTITISRYVAPSKSSQSWTLTMNDYEFDGTAHEPTINGTTRGTVTYTYYNTDTNEKLTEAPSAIGNYKVEVRANGNSSYYSRTQEATYSILNPIDKNGMANVEVFKDNDVNPEAEGKIFAGWFTDETCTTAYTEKTGKAYAKFIDEKILTVKAQISSGTTASNTSTSIRFITSVDSLKYQNVGFKITCNGKTIDRKMTKVYTAINAGGAKVKPTVFSEDSRYMEAYTLNNITKDDYDKAFTVTPYYTTQDGTIVEGATNTFTIANMIK